MTLSFLRHDDPPVWPVQPFAPPHGGWRAAIPATWPDAPTELTTPLERVWVFRGPLETNWLTIAEQPDVDPRRDVRDAERALRALTGGPSIELWSAVGADRIELLEWSEVGACAAAVGADDAVAWSGLARIRGDVPALARLYLVCARRERLAVRAFLALDSACLPGTAEAVIDANDHARAGCVLGALRLG